jgi:DNA-binding PadR family transcriptional regulator
VNVDQVDLQILSVVNETDDPWWKKLISEQIDDVSVQSIGRRVDSLQEEGYLKRVFLDLDEGPGRASIGYRISDDGQALLQSAEVCTKCEKLRRDVDHVHEFVPAAEVGHNATDAVRDEGDA